MTKQNGAVNEEPGTHLRRDTSSNFPELVERRRHSNIVTVGNKGNVEHARRSHLPDESYILVLLRAACETALNK